MKEQRPSNTAFSSRVTLYSFIMTILVVWIHAVSPEIIGQTAADTAAEAPLEMVCFCLQRILGSALGQIAVPGFFCMSGYLFFRNMENLPFREQMPVFKRKLRSRVSGLLLPYLIWNLVYYLIYLVFGKAQLSFTDIIGGVFLHKYNPVFWYMQELIFLTVAAPFLYVLIRRKYCSAAVFLLSWLLASFYTLLPFHLINEDAVCYYLAGAVLALHFKEKTEKDAAFQKYLLILGLIAYFFCELISINYVSFPNTFLIAVIGGRLSGAAVVYALTAFLVHDRSQAEMKEQKRSTWECFFKFNFLIYAVHYLEIRLIRSAAGLAGIPVLFTESAGYVLMPFICVILTAAAGSIAQRLLPRIYRIVTGGRG